MTGCSMATPDKSQQNDLLADKARIVFQSNKYTCT